MRSHAELAHLAEAQYGLVTFRQLRELGFSKGHIARSSEADRLRRIHRGVYAVGHAQLSEHGRCLAAVLAYGSNCVLSHGSAAWLWGLFPICPFEVEVTVAARGHRRRGIRVHRVAALGDRDTDVVEGIPVTSIPRTLLDIAATGSTKQLERAVERARRRGLLDLIAIDSMLSRRGGGFAGRRLQGALELYRDPATERARSELLFLDAIKREGLSRPAINIFVGEFEIDAYWEAERFAVEVDGWDTHQTRSAFENDRVRQEEMKLAGIDSIRVTARRIEREPKEVAKRLRVLLERRRADLHP